jgi:hypothetical protein
MKLDILLAAVFAVGCVAAPDDRQIVAARTVVERYCRLDAEGKALTSTTAAPMWALVVGNEQKGDNLLVISGYRVERSERDGSDVLVHVVYSVIAGYDFEALRVNPRSEKRTYRVVKTDSGWRILASSLSDNFFVFPRPVAQHIERFIQQPLNPLDPEQTRRLHDLYRVHVNQLQELAKRVGDAKGGR